MNSLVGYLSGDHRLAPRHDVRVPLRYRLRTSSAIEHAGESENLSEVGLSFLTDTDLRVGAVVDVALDSPVVLNGTPIQWLYTGHVVRVERCDSLFVKNRVAIEFDCYEVLPYGVYQSANVLPNFCIPRAVN